MRLIRGLHNLTGIPHACALTLGNFDGVHLGHQHLLQQLCAAAQARALPSTVLTFEPLPRAYFAKRAGAGASMRLMSLREKYTVLQQLGIDYLVVLPFNEQLASMPAEQFAEQVLLEKLGVRYLSIGADVRFGHQRGGDVHLLRRLFAQRGCTVDTVGAHLHTDRRVSSTWVREALQAHDLAQVAQLLGRRWSLEGRVCHGDHRGATLGYPTANIHLQTCPQLSGVFAVEVSLASGRVHRGICNLGTRPTIEQTDRVSLEVHLLDFNADLYGQHLRVMFCHYLRAELKFDSLDDMCHAMAADEQQARRFFQAADNPA